MKFSTVSAITFFAASATAFRPMNLPSQRSRTSLDMS
jgi:hypothetical protein